MFFLLLCREYLSPLSLNWQHAEYKLNTNWRKTTMRVAILLFFIVLFSFVVVEEQSSDTPGQDGSCCRKYFCWEVVPVLSDCGYLCVFDRCKTLFIRFLFFRRYHYTSYFYLVKWSYHNIYLIELLLAPYLANLYTRYDGWWWLIDSFVIEKNVIEKQREN